MKRFELTVAVNGLGDALRAAAAAAALDVPLTLLSGAGAAAYGGCDWFARVAAQTAAAVPGLTLAWGLDCGDRAGDALDALLAGCPVVVFSGGDAAAARLGDIAAGRGSRLLRRRPDALTLRPGGDAAAACRDWLSDSRRFPPPPPPLTLQSGDGWAI